MTSRTSVHGLQVATELHRFIEEKVLPGTGVDSAAFWKGFDAIVADLAPRNIALLAERDRLQVELDTWHKANPGPIRDMAAYRGFLEKIGYLVPPPAGVKSTTANVDAELALHLAQLQAQVRAHARIQRRQGFVQQQQGRIDGQRARDGHPLLLSARELGRVALLEAGQLHGLQQLGDALLRLGRGRAANRQTIAHVLRHRHVREQ